MKIIELIELAINSLMHRRLRSWLAILGIVIGVAAIISLISISVGLNESIEQNLSGLGANVITISSGGQRAERMGPPGFSGGIERNAQSGSTSQSSSGLTFRQADSLRNIDGVAFVDARVQSNARVSYKDRNTTLAIIGTEPLAFPKSAGVEIEYGRSLAISDISSAVVGAFVQSNTFNESMINKQMKIGGTTFRVVGVLKESGATFLGPDRSIYITQKAAKKLFDEQEIASSIVVVASDDYDPDIVAERLIQTLRNLRNVNEKTQDFSVTTASSIQSTISEVSNTLGLFLGAIAGISLLVGGIGVANAMFTSVLEQTKYIGLLKSLGARNNDILALFLFESGIVGLIGGVLGIILSFFGSFLLGSFGLPSKITLELIFLGLAFSVIVGVIFGLVPARNAAKIEPVESLRYE